MLLPCLHTNLINFCFLALHPLCDFCFSPALFGDEIWRSSYQTWSCLQVCPGQPGYLASHGYPGLWGGLGAAQPGRTLLAHPRQQEEGKSELKNILQTVDKPHIFSFNQFIWRRGELRMKGGIFLIPLGHYGFQLYLLEFPWLCLETNSHPVCCNRRSVELQCPRENSKCDLRLFFFFN